MQNSVRIAGDKAYITIPAANGRQPLPETEVVIDLKNLPKARVYPGTWLQAIHPETGKLFVRGWYSQDGEIYRPYFSKYIAQPGTKEQTRHIDDDYLNCLESNLVNVPIWTQDINGMKPIGIRQELEKPQEPKEQLKPAKGVCFHSRKRKWEVKPYYHGQRQSLGYWPEYQLKEANEAADFFRENGPDAYKEKFKGGM